MASGRGPARYVQPIHFEDFDGNQFERLVFAYHARTDRWLSLEWFGLSGKDKGRDIVGIRETDTSPNGELVCVLCANWQKLTLAKIKKDINKAIKSLPTLPSHFRVVCGHDIPASLRDDAKAYSAGKGVHRCDLWSGKEFEEFIRAKAESLLHRFVDGDPFPDVDKDLLLFAWGTVPIDDRERLALISLAFDRPAFSTPIHQESSLPAFRKAIDDTIRVLKTGIWQTREEHVIRRVPTKADLTDSKKKKTLQDVERHLVELRKLFDSMLRSKQIVHCNCGQPDCPVYQIDAGAAIQLAAVREKALASFQAACPDFSLDD